jgi:hypothetical protein
MNFLKKYFNLIILNIFLILLLLSITFIIKENLYINKNSDFLIKRIKIVFEKFLYSSRINFVYTNIYDISNKNKDKFDDFLKNKNNIVNIFVSKISFIKNYYKNNNKLPVLKQDKYYFVPFNYIENSNINNINFEQLMKSSKTFKNYDYKIFPINYLYIKNFEKEFFILLSLPYDYDIRYINNKRSYIIVLLYNNKRYSKFFQAILN